MNTLEQAIQQSILNGISYLYQHQFPNGDFCCYIAYEENMLHPIPEANVFPTSLISYALLGLVEHFKVNAMLQRAGDFLEYQAMRGGVWNNYAKIHPYFKVCPADVDNTACAAIAMDGINRQFQDNERLLLYNRSKEGLFYTWFTMRPALKGNKDYWRLLLREFKHPFQTLLFWTQTEAGKFDIDGAVNANALFYLGLRPETASIIDLMLKIIDEGREADCDKWYRNPFTIYYFFTRNLHAGISELEPIRKPVIERILDKASNNGEIGTGVLDTALGIISLIKLNYRSEVLDKAINYLIVEQGPDGNWVRRPLYYGGPKKLACFGSEEITTAFCLEALSLYQKEGTSNTEDINMHEV
jgi:hypothetical protein